MACHFTNLWFAAKEQNWPLADFYLAETRSHLRWAVRIIPVRKTPQGQELKLADLLDPMDKSVLKELQATIAAKDSEASARSMSRPSTPAMPATSPPGNRFYACKSPSNPRRRSSALHRNRKGERPGGIPAWGKAQEQLHKGVTHPRSISLLASRLDMARGTAPR